MMDFQGGYGKSTFSQHSMYFSLRPGTNRNPGTEIQSPYPCGRKFLRGEISRRKLHPTWTLLQSWFGIAARANTCGENRNRSKSKLFFKEKKKCNGYFSHWCNEIAHKSNREGNQHISIVQNRKKSPRKGTRLRNPLLCTLRDPIKTTDFRARCVFFPTGPF